MVERELLGMAAKAAGMKLDGPASRYVATADPRSLLVLNDRGGHTIWNPLTDDGDRYRLISKLKLSVDFDECSVWRRLASGKLIEDFWGGDYGDEPHAILRVAAEIGKAMAPSTDGGEG